MSVLFCIFSAMHLIVITPDNEVKDEITIINSLFDNGLRQLHLRKPLFTTEQYRNYIDAIDTWYHPRIVLCGSFDLLDEFSLGGAHLNSMVRNDKATVEQLKALPPSCISTSFHSWQEIEDNEFEYGYVFISPVFDSISKNGYNAGIDIKGAIRIKERMEQRNKYCPEIIGLGGVGIMQLSILHRNAFDGAAVLGAIWLSEAPVATFTKMRDVISSL